MSVSLGNIKIGKRILAGFGVVLLLLAGMAYEADSSIDEMSLSQAEFSRRAGQIKSLYGVRTDLVDARREVTLYLLRGGDRSGMNKRIDAIEAGLKPLENIFRQQVRKEKAQKALSSLADYRAAVAAVADVREDKEKLPVPLEAARVAGQVIQDNVVELSELVEGDMKTVGEKMSKTAAWSEKVVRIGGMISVVLGLFLAYVIGRSISKPIQNMTKAMEILAGGDLTVEIPSTANKDEIGQMARAVLVFKENAQRVEALQREQKEAEIRSAQERKKAMLKMADDFEASVMGVVKSVAASATEMQSTAKSMTQIAQDTSSKATTVAAASNEATANVQTVASAAEELSASTGEKSAAACQRPLASRKRLLTKANARMRWSRSLRHRLAKSARSFSSSTILHRKRTCWP